MHTVRFRHSEGEVEGIYARSKEGQAPLVVITNGHNGFYSYGMFPYIQESLRTSGISSYSFNFSHGGTVGASDRFTDLEAYEANCMRLETLDLVTVIENVRDSMMEDTNQSPLYLMSHSLGVVATLFAARECSDIPVEGIILLSPPSTLGIFPEEMVRSWSESGTFLLCNQRTGQDLPHGAELLSEIQQADTTWSLEAAIREIDTRYLIVHGLDDESVPVEHAHAIRRWIEDAGCPVLLKTIEGAGHTFNTTHPFGGPTAALDEVLLHVRDWTFTAP